MDEEVGMIGFTLNKKIIHEFLRISENLSNLHYCKCLQILFFFGRRLVLTLTVWLIREPGEDIEEWKVDMRR